ncbi:MAG: MBL fold metallo-hydrolase [Actinomycetes bacterium]
MLVAGFPSAAFGTNCYVLAPGPGEECVVVDPGLEVVPTLDDLLAEHRLAPVAVLLTHGHLDHTFSVAPVCGARGVPAYIHPDDRELLADPMKGLSSEMRTMFGGRLAWTEPDDVAELTDGAVMTLAGLEITIDHAPGHTRGSVMFRLPGADGGIEGGIDGGIADEGAREGAGEGGQVCLSGDVLFAGSIGRTDLPGGDYPSMLRSLATKVLPLADETVVLPGHGPQTTIGRERAGNPFLAEAAPLAGPSRGL